MVARTLLHDLPAARLVVLYSVFVALSANNVSIAIISVITYLLPSSDSPAISGRGENTIGSFICVKDTISASHAATGEPTLLFRFQHQQCTTSTAELRPTPSIGISSCTARSRND